jgi:ARG and Rhodanese-Phosphatase-superfamily-associated Protein domain
MTSKAAFTNAADVGWRWLETLQPDAPVEFRAITIVPLRTPKQADPPWLLLHEALAADSVEVAEISEQGSVPTLHVTNRDSRDVLLLDGEELVGAKQNRVLNTTVLVRAHSTLEVPVSCVEQGRWRYSSRRFASSAHSLYASIRLKKAAQVHASLRLRQSFSSDQGAIWSDLGERAKALKVKSFAMAGAFAAREPELDDYTAAFAPRPDQVGALVYGGRAWWGMDVLPSPRLFAARRGRACCQATSSTPSRAAPKDDPTKRARRGWRPFWERPSRSSPASGRVTTAASRARVSLELRWSSTASWPMRWRFPPAVDASVTPAVEALGRTLGADLGLAAPPRAD